MGEWCNYILIKNKYQKLIMLREKKRYEEKQRGYSLLYSAIQQRISYYTYTHTTQIRRRKKNSFICIQLQLYISVFIFLNICDPLLIKWRTGLHLFS